MKNSSLHDKRMAEMIFGEIYPMYLEKIEKKGRSKQELLDVIEWLTGYNEEQIEELAQSDVSFEAFFQGATLNPNAHLITGLICGYRVEDIENPLTQKVRYLDKLVDELVKGKKMENILRSEK